MMEWVIVDTDEENYGKHRRKVSARHLCMMFPVVAMRVVSSDGFHVTVEVNCRVAIDKSCPIVGCVHLIPLNVEEEERAILKLGKNLDNHGLAIA